MVDPQIITPAGSLNAAANPQSSWQTSPCYHFDFQGVVANCPGYYPLNITATGIPASSTLASYDWTLAAAAGTLNDDSYNPDYDAPDVPGQGTLTLKAVDNNGTAHGSDTRQVKIYHDHLARDRENFGVGESCGTCDENAPQQWQFTAFGTTVTMNNTWNCFGSTIHAYNGSGNGWDDSNDLLALTQTWTSLGFPPPFDWNTINSSLSRGDIVTIWTKTKSGVQLEHSHTSEGGTMMYGANNGIFFDFSSTCQDSWIWDECTSQLYVAALNVAAFNAGKGTDYVQQIIIFKKPTH